MEMPKLPAISVPMFQKKAEPNFGQQIAAEPKPAVLNADQGTKLDKQA